MFFSSKYGPYGPPSITNVLAEKFERYGVENPDLFNALVTALEEIVDYDKIVEIVKSEVIDELKRAKMTGRPPFNF